MGSAWQADNAAILDILKFFRFENASQESQQGYLSPLYTNKKGGIRCNVCKYWFHPECAGVTQEEYQQALKWKEKREVDIWACASCESSNEAIDNKIKEINAKVDEVKKDVTQLGDKQDKVELREQVMVTRVDKQDSEIKELRDRMAQMEADSGKGRFQ